MFRFPGAKRVRLNLRSRAQISTFSLGTLGPSVFFLGLKESCLAILFFNLLSTLPVAYFAVFGPRLGLRQMTITRFSFGYYSACFLVFVWPLLIVCLAAWVPVVLNVIACLGWSTINSAHHPSSHRRLYPH